LLLAGHGKRQRFIEELTATAQTLDSLSTRDTAGQLSYASPVLSIIMSSMQAYLAEKYMSGPKADAILSRTAPTKKKKRRLDAGPAASGGVAMIVDDDAGWGGAANPMDIDEDDAAEAIIASDRAFKKRRGEPGGEGGPGAGSGGSGWTTVREPTPPPAADEQPVVVATEEAEQPFRGGLLTTKHQRTQVLSSRDARKGQDEDEDDSALQETVYRDASGRKIDMKAEKAEAARKKREHEEREAQKMVWGKGLVQRDETENRKREEERIRQSGFTRYADDKELNRVQMDQERWNDPAAAFMTVRPLSLHPLQLALIFFSFCTSTEKENKRPAETRIHGSAPSPKSIRNQARV
jgi:pre-mRNA-splicing factor CWC26